MNADMNVNRNTGGLLNHFIPTKVSKTAHCLC